MSWNRIGWNLSVAGKWRKVLGRHWTFAEMNALLQGSHLVHMTRSLSLGHPAPLLQMIKKRSEPHLSTFNGHAIRIKFLVQTFPNSFFLLITLVSRCNTCWRLRSTLLSFTCILSLRYLRSLCAFDCDGKVGFLNMTKLKSLSAVEFKPWANWDNLHSCTSGTPCQLFETLQMPFQCQHMSTLQNTSNIKSDRRANLQSEWGWDLRHCSRPLRLCDSLVCGRIFQVFQNSWTACRCGFQLAVETITVQWIYLSQLSCVIWHFTLSGRFHRKAA